MRIQTEDIGAISAPMNSCDVTNAKWHTGFLLGVLFCTVASQLPLLLRSFPPFPLFPMISAISMADMCIPRILQ